MKSAIAIVVTMAALLTGMSADAKWHLIEGQKPVENEDITFNLGREGVYAEATHVYPIEGLSESSEGGKLKAKRFVVEVFVYSEDILVKRAIYSQLGDARDQFLGLYQCKLVQHEKYGDLHYNSFSAEVNHPYSLNRYGGLFIASCIVDPGKMKGSSQFPFDPLKKDTERDNIFQAAHALMEESFDFQCVDYEDKSITLGKFE